MSANRAIRRLFVANRGEIAVRIIDACRKLGVETVVGVSAADRDTLAATKADRAVCIGPALAAESYLNMGAVVAAAKGTGCDAIHPGYGFLAERAPFQRLCVEHGLRFVGPSAEAMEAMGDKLQARSIAQALGVPTVPGTDHVRGAQDAEEFGRKAGYSLNHFALDMYQDWRGWLDAVILKADVEHARFSRFSLLPIRIERDTHNPMLAHGEQSQAIQRDLEMMSQEFGTSFTVEGDELVLGGPVPGTLPPLRAPAVLKDRLSLRSYPILY